MNSVLCRISPQESRRALLPALEAVTVLSTVALPRDISTSVVSFEPVCVPCLPVPYCRLLRVWRSRKSVRRTGMDAAMMVTADSAEPLKDVRMDPHPPGLSN